MLVLLLRGSDREPPASLLPLMAPARPSGQWRRAPAPARAGRPPASCRGLWECDHVVSVAVLRLRIDPSIDLID